MGTEDKLYNKIKQAAENAEQKKFPAMDKVWARVEEKLETNVAKQETSNWKKIAVAASIVLVSTIGYQFYTNSNIIETPIIVNENKINQLEPEEILVKTEESIIISAEEIDKELNSQIHKPINEAVVVTEVSEKNQNIYPEEINIVSDKEVITYVRADKKVEVSSNQEDKTTSNNPILTKQIASEAKGFRQDNFNAVKSEQEVLKSKKLKPLIVIDGEASRYKTVEDIPEESLDSIIYLKEPLYIINGVEYSEQEVFGPNPTSPYSPLNKQNIIKTEILHEADAEKEYGEKGKKGVVIITTKDGKPRK